MFGGGPWSRRDSAAIVGVGLLHVAVAYLALTPSLIRLPAEPPRLTVVELAPPIREPEIVPDPPKARAARREGVASAANKRARPREMVAPPPPLLLPPPPIVAPPVASTGPDVSAGASPVEGPGSGAGGEGAGLGSGHGGTGTGGGGGSNARLLKGRLGDSDYPRAASRAKGVGTVVATLEIAATGRVSRCRVVQTSGNSDLDTTTCRLIEKRFRYKPATDSQGRPVPSVTGWRQIWWLERRD